MHLNLEKVLITTDMIKIFFMSVYTCYTFFKITNSDRMKIKNFILTVIYLVLVTLLVTVIKHKFNYFMSIAFLILELSILCSNITKNNIGYTILGIIISLSFNYIILFLDIVISYIINKIYVIENDVVNLLLMMIVQLIVLYSIFKMRKLKYGLSFFNKNKKDDYFDIIILNISVGILLCFIIFQYINILISKSLCIGFIIFAIIMFITVQKSIQLYYKHKLLIKELEETKEELENKTEEVEKLELENLGISMKSHSLVHKQKALEYKIDKLMMKTEFAEELDVKEKLDNISKELYGKQVVMELDKTGIEEIDRMLGLMQSECNKNNIDFNLQINGNIYYMINNLVAKDELEIMLADHIKDAIIAINHTDNINRSILVRLGEIDGIYSLYIYDSGVEFKKEVLENLGKRPYTTYKDEGGTGMGYMNTFETLKRHKASLIINELGKPSKDNFTKIVMIKFDGKNEYKVISYKDKTEITI